MKERFGKTIRMRGSYFMSDEAQMSDSSKRSRLSSLSIEFNY
jgi:hypothetical protein